MIIQNFVFKNSILYSTRKKILGINQSLIIKLVILVVSEVDCFKNRFIVYGLNLQQLGVVNK